MSVHHTECAALTDLPAARKLVFMALCDSADKTTGIAWPGLETMMEWSNLSRSPVMAHLKALEEDGYIARVSRGHKGKRAVFRVWDRVPCCGLHEPLGQSDEGSCQQDSSESEIGDGKGSCQQEPSSKGSSKGSCKGSSKGSCLGGTPSVSSVSSVSPSNSQLSAGAEEPTPIQTELLDYLDAQIVDAGFSKPNRTKKNTSAVRLLLEKDGKTPEQVKACIDFTFRDEFWRTNIRSMSKLREKWDQLKGARDREVAKRDPRNNLTRGQRAAAADMERYMRQREEQRQIGGLL